MSAAGEAQEPARPTPVAWHIRNHVLDLSRRPLVMGVLNVTPDSFSDGGDYPSPEAATARALAMIDEGVDIVDIGGESTRPGAAPVTEAEERERVLPLVERLVECAGVPISVDTSKAAIARDALDAGAHIINDIGGLRLDPEIASACAEHSAGLVLMHMKGRPRTMQRNPRYDDLLGEIVDFLRTSVTQAVSAGLPDTSIVVDPGIGFGKSLRHNWEVLARLDELAALGRPILVGTSRKRFLREVVGSSRADLELATLTTGVAACMRGAHVVRVHDVRAHRLMADVLEPLWAAVTARI